VSRISGDFSPRRHCNDMTDEDWDRALADGFTKLGNRDLGMKGELAGSRYLADGIAHGKTWSSFTRPYKIRATDRITTAGKARARDACALAAEGVMTNGAVVRSPIIVMKLAPVGGVALGQ